MNLIIKKQRQKHIEKYLEECEIELNNIQTYFPTLSIFEKENNKYSKWLCADLNNKLVDIVDKGKHIGIINVNNKKSYSKNFHIKCSPILESLSLLQGSYLSNDTNLWLPTRRFKLKRTTDKVCSILNSAYIESICTILTSNIRDEKYCPHFSNVYGIYNGIIDDYECDFTQEYNEFKEETWLKRALKNKKCKLKFENEECISNSIYIDNGFDELNLDSFCVNSDIDDGIINKNEEINGNVNVIHKHMPVQVFLIEKLDITLNDLFKSNCKEIKESINIESKLFKYIIYIKKKVLLKKLTSWIFQICMGLICVNHKMNFVHNDLHIDNIMGKLTEEEFLYYKINNKYFKVPTYGYTMMIIDFGRSSFIYNDQLMLGDVFSSDGEAGDQYTYPYEVNNSDSDSEGESENESQKSSDDYLEYDKLYQTLPKFSFDLARLSVSIIDDLDSFLWTDIASYGIGKLLLEWCEDDNGLSLLNLEGFDLYKHISRFCNHTTPIDQIDKYQFQEFRTKKMHKISYYDILGEQSQKSSNITDEINKWN